MMSDELAEALAPILGNKLNFIINLHKKNPHLTRD